MRSISSPLMPTHLIKWGAIILVLLQLTGVSSAQNIEQDAGTAPLGEGGAGLLLHDMMPARRLFSLHLEQRRLFSFAELTENQFALGIPLPVAQLSASCTMLDADFWRQTVARMAVAGRRAGWQAGLGCEFEEQRFADGYLVQKTGLLIEAAYRTQSVFLRSGFALSMKELEMNRLHFLASLRPGKSILFEYELAASAGQPGPDESFSFLWRSGFVETGLCWMPARGARITLAARLASCRLHFSYWYHPVLPATPAWGASWNGRVRK